MAETLETDVFSYTAFVVALVIQCAVKQCNHILPGAGHRVSVTFAPTLWTSPDNIRG